jgi:hypothetical protein
MTTLQMFFFLIQGTGRSSMGQNPRTVWVIKTLETQVGQILLGCNCPLSRGIVVQVQDPLVTFPRRGVFTSNCHSVAPTEMSKTPR